MSWAIFRLFIEDQILVILAMRGASSNLLRVDLQQAQQTVLAETDEMVDLQQRRTTMSVVSVVKTRKLNAKSNFADGNVPQKRNLLSKKPLIAMAFGVIS